MGRTIEIMLNCGRVWMMAYSQFTPENLSDAIISQVGEGIMLLDGHDRIARFNHRAESILGWREQELLGQYFFEAIHQHGSGSLACPFVEHISPEQSVVSFEDIFRKRDGAFIKVCCSLAPVRSESRLTGYRMVSFHPIKDETHEPPAQDLRHKMVRFERVFDANMFGMVHTKLSGALLDANDAFLEMIGYTREELEQGKINWRELTPPEFIKQDQHAIRSLKACGTFRPFEKQYVHKKGYRIDIMVGGMMEEGASDQVVAVVVDITAKKQFERAFMEGEKRFRTLADSAPMMIWLVNPEGRVVYVNKKAAEDRSVQEIVENGWEHYIHPGDLQTYHDVLKNALENKNYFEQEARFLAIDGTFHWHRVSGGPVIGHDGEYMGLIGVSVDIQERKEHEETLAHYAQCLEQSNKELEHFATITSHDLQEPLRKVLIFSEHLKKLEQTLLNEEALDDIDRIQRATNRMQHLITDLLDLSRITRKGKPFRKTCLSVVAEEVIAELSHTYKDIRKRIELNGTMVILADADQMYQMLFQLLDNALKFHESGHPSQVLVNIQPGQDGKQCEISVSDTGIGIEEKYFQQIFDIFIRVHYGVEYPGTGIGLALVRKIVERHGGHVTLESVPGKGSTFSVTLPVFHNENPEVVSLEV